MKAGERKGWTAGGWAGEGEAVIFMGSWGGSDGPSDSTHPLLPGVRSQTPPPLVSQSLPLSLSLSLWLWLSLWLSGDRHPDEDL